MTTASSRTRLTEAQAIKQLGDVFGIEYDRSYKLLDVWDQLDICESLKETEQRNEMPIVNGDGNGGRKLSVNGQIIEHKEEAIQELSKCYFDTPVYIVASLLRQIFPHPDTSDSHIAWIASTYTPKTINWVIYGMTKKHGPDWITLNNPAAYFTYAIKRRKRRRS